VRLDILLLKEDGTPGARGSVNFSMHSKRYWKNDFGVTTRRRRSDKVSSIRLRSPGYLRQDVLTVVGEPHPPRPIPIRRSPEPGRIDLLSRRSIEFVLLFCRTPHPLRLFNLPELDPRPLFYSGGNLFFIFSSLLDTKSYF
jgi:hypothetical protein